MRTAIFLVPHPDDELLVGGGLLYSFANNCNWNVIVVFTTNGDFYAHEGEVRIKEAINSCTSLGIKEDNIIFLGYGNDWKGEHIYSARQDKIVTSNAGRTETYGIAEHQDYAYVSSGYHHTYTRENYKKDLFDVLFQYMPDVMVCVDFDSHPDHRALNLLFREAVKQLLVSTNDYFPLILTKFAYEGMMKGEKDYHKLPHRKTIRKCYDEYYAPFPLWAQRISFKTPTECDCIRLTKNPLFKASRKYKSQGIQYHMDSAINSDMVYWRVLSENLALKAEISCSSGIPDGINDLKVIDTTEIEEKNCKYDKGIWIPDANDVDKEVKLHFYSKKSIKRIVIFENPDLAEKIERLEIKALDWDYQVHDSGSRQDIAPIVIDFNKPVEAEEISFRIIDGTTKAGFSEIEVFDTIYEIEDYAIPCEIACNNDNVVAGLFNSIVSVLDYCIYNLMILLRKVYVSPYVIMRHYPVTIGKKALIPAYRIFHVMKVLKKKIKAV